MLNTVSSQVNPAALSGALDIIIIENDNGLLKSSPWIVRFGSLWLIRHTNKIINIEVNNKQLPFYMYVDRYGRGQFFSSQSIKQTISEEKKEYAYPTRISSHVKFSAKDVQHILKNQQKGSKSTYVTDVFHSEDFGNIITRESSVCLEAALIYDDPDPEPIAAEKTSVNLSESVKSKKIEDDNIEIGMDKDAPTPSHILLNLLRPFIDYGKNEIEFFVSSLLQGPKKVNANIYLYNDKTKFVISDFDGTITTSDFMGQFLTQLGKDYFHPGLAKLYSSVSDMGFEFLYLSSRPIGQATITRKTLHRVEQDGYKLPYGPLITCADLLFTALNREVILKKPHLFKIPALKVIADLFDTNPFVFGFGNRKTDFISYTANNVDKNCVLLFDPNHRVLDGESVQKYESIEILADNIKELFKELNITR